MIGGRRGGDFLRRKKNGYGGEERERFRERDGKREECGSWVWEEVGVVARGDWSGEVVAGFLTAKKNGRGPRREREFGRETMREMREAER